MCTASLIDICAPISAVGKDTFACAVGDDTVAKRLVIEAPSMKPTIIVDPVGVKARVIYPFLRIRERRGEIALREKR